MALPLPSLSIDAALLPSLLILETVLSADNALALASLVSPWRPERERRDLLNWGLATAILLRLLAVAAAAVILRHPLLRLLGGAYLIWLARAHFLAELHPAAAVREPSPSRGEGGMTARDPSRIRMILLLAGTNLAFSLDSICAALALTDNIPLVMLAGTMGLVLLRGLIGLVLRCMERFPNLANAGYLMVLAVGLRMVGEQVAPFLTPAEPLLIGGMVVLFAWGLTRVQPVGP
jgi:YkoY family integral membrane protein